MVVASDTQKKRVHTRYNPVVLQASAGSREHHSAFSDPRKHSPDLGSKVRNGRGDSTCSARMSRSCLQSDRSDRDLQCVPPTPLLCPPWKECSAPHREPSPSCQEASSHSAEHFMLRGSRLICDFDRSLPAQAEAVSPSFFVCVSLFFSFSCSEAPLSAVASLLALLNLHG